MTYPQSLTQCHRLIAKLEDEAESLKAHLDYVEIKASEGEKLAFKYGLPRRQTDLFLLLHGREICPIGTLLDEFGTTTHVKVIIAKTRKKLQPHGVGIKNQYGVGYRLEGI